MTAWRVTATSPTGYVYRSWTIEASTAEVAINHARRAFRRARHRDPNLYSFSAIEWERPEKKPNFGWVKPINNYVKIKEGEEEAA